MSRRRNRLSEQLAAQEKIRFANLVSILIAPEYTYAYNYLRRLQGYVESTTSWFWTVYRFCRQECSWERARGASQRFDRYRIADHPHAHDGFFDQLEPEFLTLTERAREFLFRHEDLHNRIFGPAPD